MNRIDRYSTTFKMPPLFGSLETDEEAEIIARIPSLVEWWSADPLTMETRGDGRLDWRGKVKGATLRTATAAVPLRTQGLNGRHTLELDGTQEFDAVDFLLPAGDVTVLIVQKLTGGTGLRALFGTAGVSAPTKALQFLYSSGVGRLVNSASASILIDPGTTQVNNDNWVMATQSQTDGMSLWRNGAQVAYNAALTTPLDDRTFGFGNVGSGTTARFIGEVSDIMIFDANLRAPSQAAILALLNNIVAGWLS